MNFLHFIDLFVIVMILISVGAGSNKISFLKLTVIQTIFTIITASLNIVITIFLEGSKFCDLTLASIVIPLSVLYLAIMISYNK
ncbi:MAG: hypothetical protein [Caudoviricetes sp.]|nr:MAG: hypothetical protein [Caudoviricetes sp.]